MVILFAALVVPTFTVPKFSDVGLRLRATAPDPVRLMVCGLLLALSLILTVPVWGPVVVGLKVTVMVHCPFAGMLVPQVFTCVYADDPLMVMLISVNGTL